MPNKRERFLRVRVTYTHLAVWTNAQLSADRLRDTILRKDVTHLEDSRRGSDAYFYKIIKLYVYIFIWL